MTLDIKRLGAPNAPRTRNRKELTRRGIGRDVWSAEEDLCLFHPWV